MAIKLTGAEWNRFYNDTTAWPDGWYHEDAVVSVDGVLDEYGDLDLSTVADDAEVVVSGGIIYKGDYSSPGNSVEGHLRKWRKAQTMTNIIVEVPKDRLEAVKEMLASLGAKVVR